MDVVVKSILHGRAEGFPCLMGCLNIYTGSTFLSRLSLQNRKKKKKATYLSAEFLSSSVVAEKITGTREV